MEVIVKQIDFTRPDKFYFYDLSDLHLGAVHADEDALIEKVYEIKSLGRQAIVLGGGDYGDCITPNDLKRWDARVLAPWLVDDMDTKLPPWMRSNMDNIGPGILDRVDQILSPIWGQFAGLIEGIRKADAFIGVYEQPYHYKGAIAELGAALALGKRCIIIGKAIDSCIFSHHPSVERYETLEYFLETVEQDTLDWPYKLP